MAQAFMDGETELKPFLRDFIKSRTLAHMRRAKVERAGAAAAAH